MLLWILLSTSETSAAGVVIGSGTDLGNSISITSDEPALLGMLKEGPHDFGPEAAAGESTKAEAVLEAAAGVSVLFLSSSCLNNASRSGSIFFGTVMVFLAALSYSKSLVNEYQIVIFRLNDKACRHQHDVRARLGGAYRSIRVVGMLFDDSIYSCCLYDVEENHAGSKQHRKCHNTASLWLVTQSDNKVKELTLLPYDPPQTRVRSGLHSD